MDCSPPGSSVRGILQARNLEWVASSFSRDLPDPGLKPTDLHLLYFRWILLPLSLEETLSVPWKIPEVM